MATWDDVIPLPKFMHRASAIGVPSATRPGLLAIA